MIQPEKLFEDCFDDINITSTRLANFTNDCINRLTVPNISVNINGLAEILIDPLAVLETELDSVDTSIGVQKGKTLTLNQFIVLFKLTMKEKEGVIADAIGGFKSEGFMEFYPKGLNEYTSASKLNLPTLIGRVNTLATAHAEELSVPLRELLQAFDAQWVIIRNQQERQKGNVEDNRNGRTDARRILEVALMTVIHAIGGIYPGNAEQCMRFFNFNLLLPSTARQKKETFKGPVTAGQTAIVVNRAFAPETKVRIRNTSDNASVFAFLAPLGDTEVNGSGREIKAGKSKNFLMADLGDTNDTFLLLHNLSAVNNAGYEIVV